MSNLLKWRRVISGLQMSVMVASILQCSSWRVQNVAPVTLIMEKHPGKVRIGRADGTAIVLREATVVGDSIIGRKGAVAVGDAAAVSLLKFDALKTLGLLGGLAIGSAIVCAAADCLDIGPIGLDMGS